MRPPYLAWLHPPQRHRNLCMGMFLCKTQKINKIYQINMIFWACQSAVPIKEGHRGIGTWQRGSLRLTEAHRLSGFPPSYIKRYIAL